MGDSLGRGIERLLGDETLLIIVLLIVILFLFND